MLSGISDLHGHVVFLMAQFYATQGLQSMTFTHHYKDCSSEHFSVFSETNCCIRSGPKFWTKKRGGFYTAKHLSVSDQALSELWTSALGGCDDATA